MGVILRKLAQTGIGAALSILCVLSAAVHSTVMAAGTAPQSGTEMLLWYEQPAGKWLEALPLGNGMLGAMVFGGIERERIALNESTFWSGRPHDYDRPGAHDYFTKIRDLVFAGKFQEAEKMADERFYGVPAAQQAFQPLGDLILTFDGIGKAEEYARQLDLERGLAKTSFHVGEAIFTREVFVSYPDRVMVIRISGTRPRSVSLRAQLQSKFQESAKAASGKLVMDGCWSGPITNNWLIAPVDGKGLRFQVRLVAVPEGGQLQDGTDSIFVRGADAVTFIVATATSFVNYRDINGDPKAACERTIARAVGKDYPTLRRRHEEDFRGLMGRVRLKVGDVAMNGTATDERLKAVREGRGDPNL